MDVFYMNRHMSVWEPHGRLVAKLQRWLPGDLLTFTLLCSNLQDLSPEYSFSHHTVLNL